MKNKFKVGDIVRATKKSDELYNITNSSNMTKGEVVEVLSHKKIKIRVIENKYNNCVGYEFPVNTIFFEKVKPEKIVIYRKDRKVIALDKSTGKKTIARCHPEDEFDFMTGAKLAFERLTGIQINNDYLNTKIVFAEPDYCDRNGRILIKAGKVYEIKNGKFYNENDNLLPLKGSFRNMEDVHAYFGGSPTEIFGRGGFRWNSAKPMMVVEVKEEVN